MHVGTVSVLPVGCDGVVVEEPYFLLGWDYRI